jgi:quercetin dioxygenase-like cupin family protein
VRSGTRSLPHSHEERELFICISGQARVHLNDRALLVTKGDVVFIPPGTHHFVDAESETEDFHLYAIWWDRGSANAFIDQET